MLPAIVNVNTQPSLCHYAVPLIRSRHATLYKCVLIDWLINIIPRQLKQDIQKHSILLPRSQHTPWQLMLFVWPMATHGQLKWRIFCYDRNLWMSQAYYELMSERILLSTVYSRMIFWCVNEKHGDLLCGQRFVTPLFYANVKCGFTIFLSVNPYVAIGGGNLPPRPIFTVLLRNRVELWETL